MKVHSDKLQRADFGEALRASGIAMEGVWIDTLETSGSRSRRYGWNVHLSGVDGRDRNGKARRPSNSGKFGAGSGKAATYDEWGYWIAQLFEKDPEMVFGPYKGREHFHEFTRGHYRERRGLAMR